MIHHKSLIEAVKARNVFSVKNMLNGSKAISIDVNFMDELGNTALYYACCYNDLDEIKYCSNYVDGCYRVDVVRRSGYKQLEIIKELLNYSDIDVNVKYKVGNIYDGNICYANLIFLIVDNILKNCDNDMLVIFSQFVENDKFEANVYYDNVYHIIEHICCYIRRFFGIYPNSFYVHKMLKCLLKRHDIIVPKNIMQYYSFMRGHDLKIIDMLLERNEINVDDNIRGEIAPCTIIHSLLDYATSQESKKYRQTLLCIINKAIHDKKADVNIKNEVYGSYLYLASCNGSLDIVKILLSRKDIDIEAS